MAQIWADAFYHSPEWIKVREFVRMRDRYICQRCGRPMQEVHHIIHLTEDNIWDPKITLNPDNLISLCRACHFAIHEEDKAKGHKDYYKNKYGDCAEGFHFDENGQLVPDGNQAKCQ